MSIRTLHTDRIDNRVIAEVEIVDAGAFQTHRSWEFHCNECDEFSSGLSEAVAREELRDHVCVTKCVCGYDTGSAPDLDNHILTTAKAGAPEGAHHGV